MGLSTLYETKAVSSGICVEITAFGSIVSFTASPRGSAPRGFRIPGNESIDPEPSIKKLPSGLSGRRHSFPATLQTLHSFFGVSVFRQNDVMSIVLYSFLR